MMNDWSWSGCDGGEAVNRLWIGNGVAYLRQCQNSLLFRFWVMFVADTVISKYAFCYCYMHFMFQWTSDRNNGHILSFVIKLNEWTTYASGNNNNKNQKRKKKKKQHSHTHMSDHKRSTLSLVKYLFRRVVKCHDTSGLVSRVVINVSNADKRSKWFDMPKTHSH